VIEKSGKISEQKSGHFEGLTCHTVLPGDHGADTFFFALTGPVLLSYH